MRRRTAAAAAALMLLVAACSGPGGSGDPSDGGPGGGTGGTLSTYDPSPDTLTIVAGSEQRAVVDQVVQPWCSSTGVTCRVNYLGSVDQARLLQSGTAPYDAFWFASSVFAQLGDQDRKLQDLQPMSLTPIVFAGWKSEMEGLGFVGKDVTIEQVLDAVESQETSTWVTNPTQSNSGASAYLAFLNYFAGNGPGQPLTADELDRPEVADGITRFVRAFDRTPPSTGTLMDDCLAKPDQCRTMFTYEDLVIERNQKLVAEGREPLYVVYPQGALAIADAPLGFLPHGTGDAAKKTTFDALQTYLLTDKGAQEAMLRLGRRPADITGLNLTGAPADVFSSDWGIRTTIKEQQLAYPSGDVIDRALNLYQDSFRSPADVVYCIDGSGSMADNEGWDGVVKAADLLFDQEQARTYFLQVNPGDRTTALVFNDGIKAGPITVEGDNEAMLLGLRDQVVAAGPDGGTAIYDCLGRAAEHFRANDSGTRKKLVILMTDGQNQDGGVDGLDQIAALGVPVIAVGFGSDADAAALTEIADRTRGAFIKSDNLVSALRSATSYR